MELIGLLEDGSESLRRLAVAPREKTLVLKQRVRSPVRAAKRERAFAAHALTDCGRWPNSTAPDPEGAPVAAPIGRPSPARTNKLHVRCHFQLTGFLNHGIVDQTNGQSLDCSH